MFKVGGKYWDGTKEALIGELLPIQETDGSWRGEGSERRTGAVYCTSMAVLGLAVEYQYLPIYQR
jgi:hypothetical protein